ncbi:trimeric intracellular cation channel family protein [Lysinibacillus yapensis]|uniref:Trimeric intracellular cation channel family protein n=1 Tax=Ureibacillus yapensis TaxID=2304605 RepID=A0A396SD03_9BACL|nr:trimeric intracellular cation channel family protein [Lysinibacillus yapensis]RHW39500.1 trimeric intracellular cation channel family protein [Lysinibacillus yapensis]
MAWEFLNIIGTIAFAISGAIVAMEEECDLFGVYLLGMVTAFGGGAVRNLLIGLPPTTLWNQELLFQIAFGAITLFFLMPNHLFKQWSSWGQVTDAVGLSAFAIQGAIYAVSLGLPIEAVIGAAVLTGTGGGMIRDVLARRKPMIVHEEVYAVWAAGAGFLIGLDFINGDFFYYTLFIIIVILRVLSYTRGWRLPVRSFKK